MVRENGPDSNRVGLVLQAEVSIGINFSLSANATFSENKIVRYTQYTDMYDADFNYLGQQATEYKRSDIAFSPSLTANGIIGYQDGRLNVELSCRYVSCKYLAGIETKLRLLHDWYV